MVFASTILLSESASNYGFYGEVIDLAMKFIAVIGIIASGIAAIKMLRKQTRENKANIDKLQGEVKLNAEKFILHQNDDLKRINEVSLSWNNKIDNVVGEVYKKIDHNHNELFKLINEINGYLRDKK